MRPTGWLDTSHSKDGMKPPSALSGWAEDCAPAPSRWNSVAAADRIPVSHSGRSFLLVSPHLHAALRQRVKSFQCERRGNVQHWASGNLSRPGNELLQIGRAT